LLLKVENTNKKICLFSFAHLVVGKLEEVITCLTSGGTIFDVHLTSCWRSILIHRCGSE